jgi:hypothetical protein
MMKDTLGVLLAGGAGERLYPLTRDRAKPAVTFGGIYRIIDITLSNCVNSGLRRVYILTQYKALSLNRQIREGWNIFGREIGEFIEILPPMKRVSDNWYMGTADAVYQNIYSIGSEQPKYVLILSGDHIYKMNYERMLQQHQQDSGADVTVATLLTEPSESAILAWSTSTAKAASSTFIEKPNRPIYARPTIPPKFRPRWASTSSTPTCSFRCCSRTPRIPSPAMTSAKTFCPMLERLSRLFLQFCRRKQERGALLARRGDARSLLRSQHGPGLGLARL